MYHCKTCGWKFFGKYCPRCGSLNFDESSCVTLSSYDGSETDVETDEDRASYARSTLWDALHEAIPDKIKCLSCASALLTYVPGDYLASFARVAYSSDEKALSDFLWKSLSKDVGMYAEVVLDFVCSHMSANLYYAVRSFIDRAGMKDPTKYETVVNGYFPGSVLDTEELESEIREIAERVVKDVVEREMNETVKLIDEEKKEETEKMNRMTRGAAERIVKEIAVREVREAVGKELKENAESTEREICETAGKFVKEIAEKEIRDAVEREVRRCEDSGDFVKKEKICKTVPVRRESVEKVQGGRQTERVSYSTRNRETGNPFPTRFTLSADEEYRRKELGKEYERRESADIIQKGRQMKDEKNQSSEKQGDMNAAFPVRYTLSGDKN